MNAESDIVATLKFSGKRFRNGAFALTAVRELERFQRVVLETAKFLWRKANPDASRLPSGFDERVSLCFRGSATGSSVVPIELSSNSGQQELAENDRKSVVDAINLGYDIVSSIDHNQLVPQGVTRAILAEYMQLGRGLVEGEVMEFAPPKKPFIQLTSEFMSCIKSRIDRAYEDVIDIFVSVYEVNFKSNTLLFESDYGNTTKVSFDDEQSKSIVRALEKCGTP